MPINKMFGSTTLRNLIQARTKDSNIKVVFGSKEGSRTDGNTIYVADVPDSADPDVRILAEKSAYHEAEHVRALDEYRKTNPNATIPGLINRMQKQCLPQHASLAANIWNAIEDARIDNTENDRYPGTIEKYRDATRIFNERLDTRTLPSLAPPNKILLMLWYKSRERYYAKHGIDGVPSIFSDEDEELFNQTLAPILPKIDTLTGIDDSIALAKEAYDLIVEAFKEPPPPQQQEQDESTSNDSDEDTDVNGNDSSPDHHRDPGSDNNDRDKAQSHSKPSQNEPEDDGQTGSESDGDESGMDSDEEEVDDNHKPSKSNTSSDRGNRGGLDSDAPKSEETEDQAGNSSSDPDPSESDDTTDSEQADDGSDPSEQDPDLDEDDGEVDDEGRCDSDQGDRHKPEEKTTASGQKEGKNSGSHQISEKGPKRSGALEGGLEALEGNPTLDINGALIRMIGQTLDAFYSVHPLAEEDHIPSMNIKHSQGHRLVANGNRFFAGTEGKIRRLLVDERAPKIRDSLRSGHKLDTRHLYRTTELKMGKTPMIWKDVQEGRKIDTAVSLIIDQSGSMEGPNWQTVSFLTAALCKIFDSLSVKYAVVGIDSSGTCPYSEQKEGERIDNVRYYRYNLWGKRLNPNAIPIEIYGGGTPTAEMVKLGLTELGQRTEVRKVLMIMTDGEPSYNGSTTPYAIQLCKEQIQAARKYGGKVFGFGININPNSTNHKVMEKIFGKGWVDLPNFTQDANKHASRIMQKLEEAFRE